MSEQPVKGEEAVKRMAAKILSQSSNQGKDTASEADPLKEAADFTKKMAANAMIEGQVAKMKADIAKAEAEAREAEARARKAEGGGGDSAGMGLQVKGKIDYGDVNLQAEREEYKREAREAQSAMAVEIEKMKADRDAIRDQLHKEQIEGVKNSLQTQLQEQNRRLEELIKERADSPAILNQFKLMKETAKELGFVQPTTGGSLEAEIALKKLEFELEDRKHQHELDIIRLQDERTFRREELQDKKAAMQTELALKQKHYDFLAKLPQELGDAIGMGIARGAASQPEAPAVGKTVPGWEMGVGESLEFECDNCQTPVAIGPTARSGVCVNCGTRYPIKRVAREPVATQPELQPEEE